MSFAHPAALGLLALAIPVLLLHILRPRRQAVVVSSTYLWRGLARPVSAASPWQKLRPSLLLFLQLLAVVLLAVAAARPVRATGTALARHTVFIVDGSGSMAATDGRPDRIAAAVERAKSLRGRLPAGGVASVVVASSQPRVALTASPDRRAFDEALGALPPAGGSADYPAAFTLAESLETPGTPVGFVFLSDGRLDEASRTLLPPGTRYERMGDRATNRGISLLSVERRGAALTALVTVRNTGGPSATQTLRLDVDGRTAERAKLRLGEGATVTREFDLPAGERVEAFLEGADLLAADNHAYATAGGRRPVRVVLAGQPDPEANLFLDRLLAALPGATVERTPVAGPAPGADLVVYDRVPVPAQPGAPFLAIAPPGGAPGVAVTGEVEQPALTLVRSEHPLLAGVDLSGVGVAKAQRLEPAGDDEVLVASEDTPLLVAGQRAGRPFAYLGFALADSNLPVEVAFPILGERILAELAGAVVPPADLRTGQALPVPEGAAVTVNLPAGRRVEVPAGAAGPVADRPGFYRIRLTGTAGTAADRAPAGAERVVAVNAEPSESFLAPVRRLPVAPRAAAPGERAATGERSLLAWVVIPLLAVLAAELLVSRRSRGVPRRQWRAGLVARAVIVACLVAALVGLTVPGRSHRVATVFLVDASDSMGPGGKEAALEWVRDALDAMPRGARAGVALFGGDTRVEHTVSPRVDLGDAAVRIDASRTNLAGALRLAAAILPSDARRRIVVVSDGRATEGDADAEARRLGAEGIDVDVHAVEGARGPDVAVSAVDAPALARRGETVKLTATVSANRAGPARLTLYADDAVAEERTLDLPAGETPVEFTRPAGGAGLTRYRLEVDAAGDTIAQNDSGFAAVTVEGPARVLIAEGAPGEGETLAEALRAGGTEVDRIGAGDLPALDRLSAYASVVLVDVDVRTLSAGQVAALGSATRDLGKGLVVVGGDQSYALGGYRDSELERLLPVISDVTDPKRRQSVAEVLAIDSSGSMAACHCREDGTSGMGGNFRGGAVEGGVNKTDISREAATRAIGALAADDQVGILAFNTEQKFVVPLQTLPSDEVVSKGLAGLTPAGGTDLTRPLQTAAAELRKAKARLKHIVLFTDGFTSEGGLAALTEQAAALADEGITVSVLATGEGAAAQLKGVADAGRGRFYPGRDLSEIPQLMAAEVVLASRNFVNEGEFVPKVVGSSPATESLTETPALLGFLATTAKPAAENLLRIGPEDDPLLATWRVGLGRATAWTSDASARWSQLWAEWGGYGPFWAAVVKETFPVGGAAGTGVRAALDGRTLRVAMESEQPWPADAAATARVALPDGTSREVPLRRTAGNRFAGEIEATAPGSYAVGVSVTSATAGAGAGSQAAIAQAATLASQAYPPEYRPGEASPEGLERVSLLSGGRGAIKAGDAFESAGLRAGRSRLSLAGWLLLVAAVAWPLDIALRRLAFRGTLLRPVTAAGALGARSARRALSRLPFPRRSNPDRGGRSTRPAPDPGNPPPPPPPPPPPAPAPDPVPAAPTTVGRLLERKRQSRPDAPDDR